MSILAQTSTPPLASVIKDYETRHRNLFRPSKPFYEAVGINRIRFARMWKGTVDPTVSEVKALASFFEVSVDKLI